MAETELKGKDVLLVDDDMDILLRQTVADRGADITTATGNDCSFHDPRLAVDNRCPGIE